MGEGQVWKRVGKTATTWYFRVDVPTADGRRRQVQRGGFRTRREAEAAKAQVIREAGNGELTDRTTLAEFLALWHTTVVQPHKSPATAANYRVLCDLHVLPTLGSLPLARLQPETIQALYAELQARGRRDGRGGLSTASIRLIHAILHAALEQAVRWRKLTRNPASLVSLPARDTAERDFLAPATVAQLLAGAATQKVEHWLVPAILLGIGTGCRRGEALGLAWSDLQLTAAPPHARIVRALKETKTRDLYFGPPKSGRPRPLALSSVLVDELALHQARQATWRDRAGDIWQGEWGTLLAGLELILTDEDGSPVRPSALTRNFAVLAARCGQPGLHYHDLRHSRITSLVEAGIDVRTISQAVGHASAQITLDTYTHPTPRMQAAAAEATDTVLREVLKKARGF